MLSELQRLIEEHGAVPEVQRLDPAQVSDRARLTVPAAAAYVIEANARNRATEAIVEEILSRYPEARLVVVAEKFEEATAFPLLRVGIKGLLCYFEQDVVAPHCQRYGHAWVLDQCFVAGVRAGFEPRSYRSRQADADVLSPVGPCRGRPPPGGRSDPRAP